MLWSISSKTKDTCCTRKTKNSVVVFLVHIKDITLATRMGFRTRMAIPIAAVQPLAAFDPHGDQNSVAQQWERWIRSSELFSIATGCNDDKQKRHLFLHTAGNEVQEKLDEYFSPRKNTSYNRHTFRKEKQRESESVSQFTTRLRQLISSSM